jgi:GTP-binding protein LepA
MDPESREGITIKSQPFNSIIPITVKQYVSNNLDTRHVDFSYEVSRAIASCEGALLVVDATQGVQAQTISNLYLAISHNLEIIPILNKIDMDAAMVDVVRDQVIDLLGCKPGEVLLTSARTGEGVAEVLEAIVERIPPPTGNSEALTA